MSDKTNKDKESIRKDASIVYTFLSDNVHEISFGVSHDEFRDILMSLDKKPSSTKKLYDIVKNSVINEVIQDIDGFWEETEFSEKYNEITKLTNECKNQQETWRPKPPSCDNTLNAYFIKNLQERKEKLQETVSMQQILTQQKREILEKRRNKLKSQLNNAHDLVNHLEKSTNIIYALQMELNNVVNN